MAFDFNSYQMGLGFLRRWWARSPNAPSGEMGFQAAMKKYADDKIIVLGKVAGQLSYDKQSEVISRAISEYGASTPSFAAWNTMLMEKAATLDYVKIATESSKEIGAGLAKAAVFGASAYLGVGLLVGGLVLYQNIKNATQK